jgi:hypothetical protein
MIFSFSIIEQLFLLSMAILVLFLPGLVWIVWFPGSYRDPVERIADSLGISLSIIALMGMLFFFTGWRFSSPLIFLLTAICLLAISAAFLSGRIQIKWKTVRFLLLAGLLLLGMIVWRFYQARTLVLPAWVDSVHHVLIVQKILDSAGLPHTLGPELPVPFTYHFGFHITTAIFSAISGLEPVKAVLWFGQVINAFVALGIYRLAKTLWRSRRVALIAALLVTFAFQMPAYYLTWGRYTLLTGLLVMLPAMAAVFDLIILNKGREVVARLLILTAGLALVHYMALLFLGLFIGCLLLIRFLDLVRPAADLEDKQRWWGWRWSVIAATIGILLAMPWLIRMLASHQAVTTIKVAVPSKQDFLKSFDYILYLMGPTHNYILLGLAAAGLVLSWFQKKSRGLALWASLMLVLSIPWGLKLGPFRPDHMAIVLFIPASCLLANGLVWLTDFLTKRFNKAVLFSILLIATSLFLLIWGAWHTRDIINPVTVLTDNADLAALNWIKVNTPDESRFLANTTGWQYATYRGVDGGYWITPLTRRYSVAMPSFYGYAAPDQRALWVDWIARASNLTSCDENFWSLVSEADLDYLYLHTGKGTLLPANIQECTGIWPVYDKDGVFIYILDEKK